MREREPSKREAMKRTRRLHGSAFKTQVAFVTWEGDTMLAEVAIQFSSRASHPDYGRKPHMLRGSFDVFGETKRVGTGVRLIC
jgi:hypothetical protein